MPPDPRARPAALGLMAFAGLVGLASLLHPTVPGAPVEAAPLVLAPAWLLVHGVFLAAVAALAWAARRARDLVPAGGLLRWWRGLQARGAARGVLVGAAVLAAAMLVELAWLPTYAGPALQGDLAAANEFALWFGRASLLFHGGMIVLSVAALRLTRLLRRHTPWWFRAASTVGLVVAVLASLAATPFPAPLTLFLGAPAVAIVAAWAGLLGLLLLVRRPAPRGMWDALAGA